MFCPTCKYKTDDEITRCPMCNSLMITDAKAIKQGVMSLPDEIQPPENKSGGFWSDFGSTLGRWALDFVTLKGGFTDEYSIWLDDRDDLVR